MEKIRHSVIDCDLHVSAHGVKAALFVKFEYATFLNADSCRAIGTAYSYFFFAFHCFDDR